MFGQDIGIDLGTSSVRVYVKGKGVVIDEPSVVAVEKSSGKLLAVGEEAQNMLGRTPGNITAVKPIREGVISDYTVAEKMLRYLIHKAANTGLFGAFMKPKVVISVPSDVTEVEERAVIDAGMQAGAGRVYLIEEPLAAALGVGVDISEPTGNVIVDIGGGTCDIAVVSLGGIVISASIKVAGDNFDEAIIRYIRKKYNVLVGECTAEQIKISIGCVYRRDKLLAMEARGRSLITGLPKTIQISSDEILDALKESAGTVVDGIRTLLEKTPPELIGDICRNGIILTGAGARIYGMAKLINRELNMKAELAEDPETCVIRGTAKAIDDPKALNTAASA
ncbi:MAG TPA: rod shape-determining protein [Firmicutes bacterium]|nr:rod shape-determining protein [Bacillota bacterium]